MVMQRLSDFIVITLGTGLGSGIVCNGKLVEGSEGFAAELGHFSIDSKDRYTERKRRFRGLCICNRYKENYFVYDV